MVSSFLLLIVVCQTPQSLIRDCACFLPVLCLSVCLFFVFLDFLVFLRQFFVIKENIATIRHVVPYFTSSLAFMSVIHRPCQHYDFFFSLPPFITLHIVAHRRRKQKTFISVLSSVSSSHQHQRLCQFTSLSVTITPHPPPTPPRVPPPNTNFYCAVLCCPLS